jgi:hypothetical protein
MGSDLVKLQIKRLSAGHEAADQTHSDPLEDPGRIVAAPLPVVDSLSVPGQIPVVVRVLAPVQLGVPPVPARRHRGLVDVVVVAVEELPNVGRHIPRPAQPGRQHVPLLTQGGIGVLEHAVVVPILAGEQGGPRGTAQGVVRKAFLKRVP